MAVGKAQVGDWLRSMELEGYLQAFLDNGYDDMEVCRFIGDPDLDAIGVDTRDHRRRILEAVKMLLENDTSSTGPAPVYYTLENPEYDDPPRPDMGSPEGEPPRLPPRDHSLRTWRLDAPHNMPPRPPTVPCGTSGVGDPSTEVDMADEENERTLRHVVDQPSSFPIAHAPSFEERMSLDSYPSDHSNRSRHTSGGSSSTEGGRRIVGIAVEEPSSTSSFRGSSDSLNKDKHDAMESERSTKKSSTLGKLFRSKKPSQKYTYKPHQGDPAVSDLCKMSDNDRMQLMLLVKDGKLSQDQVLERVKQSTMVTGASGQSADHPDGTRARDVGKKTQKSAAGGRFKSKILQNFKQKIKQRGPELSQEQPFSQHSPRHPADAHSQGSLQTGGATETSSGDIDDYHHDQLDRQSSKNHGRQWPTEDLTSDGMSAHTPSSSLDSVHSAQSGVHSHSSSSSLDDPSHPKQPICLARVREDYIPSPYAKKTLTLKKGDIIQVLNKCTSGNWLGRLNDKLGYFKFVNVDILSDEASPKTIIRTNRGQQRPASPIRMPSSMGGPSMVEIFLNNFQLQHLASMFHLNNFVTLDEFKGLTETELMELQLSPDDTAKVLDAVQQLQAGKGIRPREYQEKRDSSGRESPLCTESPKSHRAEPKLSGPTFRSKESGRARYRETLWPTSRKIDSGFESIMTDSVISVESKGRESLETGNLSSVAARLHHRSAEYLDDTQMPALPEYYMQGVEPVPSCDKARLGPAEHKYMTIGHSHMVAHKERQPLDSYAGQCPHGSLSKIPQIRSRTNSLDQTISKNGACSPQLPKKVHRSRHHELASASDHAYSSAPNSPLLQRGTKHSHRQSRQSRRAHESPSPASLDGAIAAAHPHLSVVKTAHVRSLGCISKSVPSSPGAIPRISPAARSSVHAHPRAGKHQSWLKHRGVEARAIEPVHFPQGENPKSFPKCTPDPNLSGNITMATILSATGLSQYEADFTSRGILTTQHFMNLTENDFRNLGVYSKDHVRQLMAWQEQLETERGQGRKQDTARHSSKPHRFSNVRDNV